MVRRRTEIHKLEKNDMTDPIPFPQAAAGKRNNHKPTPAEIIEHCRETKAPPVQLLRYLEMVYPEMSRQDFKKEVDDYTAELTDRRKRASKFLHRP